MSPRVAPLVLRAAAAFAGVFVASACCADAAGVAPPASAATAAGAATALGAVNPQRAWQNWTLNCQGCHRPDGSGSQGAPPSIAGSVAKFLRVRGGREYLGRVPGVATSPLSNGDLAEVLNWMLWRFDSAGIPANFQPYTADEVGLLRARPLRIEASQMRRDLLRKADRSPTQ